MTLPLGQLAAWAAWQVATLPDTIVTRQISEPRSWFDVVSGIASIVIAVALMALAVGLLPAAFSFRKSYKKVNELLDRIYGDVNPIMRHASSVADNVNYVTTALRQDVARLQGTVAAANAQLEQATRITQRRVNDFNALLEVVQNEAESTFIATAATVRGLRGGVEQFSDDARRPPRRRRSWDHEPAAAPDTDPSMEMAYERTRQDAYDDPADQAGEAGDEDQRPRIRPRGGRGGRGDVPG